jgi:hypothetical protein
MKPVLREFFLQTHKGKDIRLSDRVLAVVDGLFHQEDGLLAASPLDV